MSQVPFSGAADIQILVLQSTSFCNIDCSYCYLPDRTKKGAMPEHVLKRVAEEVIGSRYWRPDSLVLWHAGEPLVCGVDWYRRAHDCLASRSTAPLRIQFQTNGTLIDSSWTEFFKTARSWVGVSVDGPRDLHDSHRRDRRGRPTFDLTMRGISRLREAEIPFTAIAVVTDAALDRPDDIYDFFDELRPEVVGFSIEEAEGDNAISSLYEKRQAERVEHFFRRLAQRTFESSNPIRIREIDATLRPFLCESTGTHVSQEVRMGWIVAIGANGDVALFSPEHLTTRQPDGNTLAVGNILTQTLDEIFAGEAARKQRDEIARGVEACSRSCRYFRYCGGGSPSNKYFEKGRFDVTETQYCRLAKQALSRGIMNTILDSRRKTTGPNAT